MMHLFFRELLVQEYLKQNPENGQQQQQVQKQPGKNFLYSNPMMILEKSINNNDSFFTSCRRRCKPGY